MTVTNAFRRNRYEGNSSARSFSYSFQLADASELLAVVTDPQGRETVLALDADYSVSGIGAPEGGFVLYPLSGPALPPGHYLTLVRNIPYTQLLDLGSQDAWLPEVVEGALDRLTMQVLQVKEESERTLRFPVGTSASNAELPSPNGPGVLGFDEGGQLKVLSVPDALIAPRAVFVSPADLTPGYLGEKVSSGVGVELSLDPGSNQTLVVSAPFAGRVSETDDTPGYLSRKLASGVGVALELEGIGGDETLAISAPTAGRIDHEDAAPGFLVEKLLPGEGVSLTVDTDEEGEKTMTVALSGGAMRDVKVFANPGGFTWSKPAWLKFAEVWVLGGGGGGQDGGTAGGGGGAAYAFLGASELPSTVAVTVGAAGLGGHPLQTPTAGGTSSFGAFAVATGGDTGAATAAGGSGTAGTIQLDGGYGSSNGLGGNAPGPYGGGVGAGYGSGRRYGGGGPRATGTGGNGGGGLVVVKEYSV